MSNCEDYVSSGVQSSTISGALSSPEFFEIMRMVNNLKDSVQDQYNCGEIILCLLQPKGFAKLLETKLQKRRAIDRGRFEYRSSFPRTRIEGHFLTWATAENGSKDFSILAYCDSWISLEQCTASRINFAGRRGVSLAREAHHRQQNGFRLKYGGRGD